jgi:hemerythrin
MTTFWLGLPSNNAMNYPHIAYQDFEDSIVKDAFSHYDLGFLIIDQQHRELYVGLCDLRDKSEHGDSQEDLFRLIDHLVSKMRVHVATENRLMHENNYEYEESHTQSNLHHLKDLVALYQNTTPEFIVYTINVILNHIDYHDRLMVESFKNRSRRFDDIKSS